MEIWKKIKNARKINKAVNKIRKESKNWLCDSCRKNAKSLTQKGHNFVDLILNSEEHFCDDCSMNIKNLLKDYASWN